MITTLPTDPADRKEFPLFEGCLAYFPAALAGVAQHSKAGNDRHNPGEPMHHARGKSGDHADCIMRHLMDLADMMASLRRGGAEQPAILGECNALAWRALALSQELHERLAGVPMAPNARAAKGDVPPAPSPGERCLRSEALLWAASNGFDDDGWHVNTGVGPRRTDMKTDIVLRDGTRVRDFPESFHWELDGIGCDIMFWKYAD